MDAENGQIEDVNQMSLPSIPTMLPIKSFTPPVLDEVITCLSTNNSYTMGEKIGEGSFGVVYSCKDVWGNDLATKVLKPTKAYDKVKASALAETGKLLLLRHPHITYVFDAFEFRDTFYIITERCQGPLKDLFSLKPFMGLKWLMPIARCLLQATHYLHLNQYAHQDIHLGNVFATFAKDEMSPTEIGSIQFKLGDLGVSKLFSELDAMNTLADWMRPPEALYPLEFGTVDNRIDIYHIGLLLLQLAHSQELYFTQEEILAGRPREMALSLSSPYNVALEKALRRHVASRTASAMELWHDLKLPESTVVPELT